MKRSTIFSTTSLVRLVKSCSLVELSSSSLMSSSSSKAEFSGWLNFDPSLYNALAFIPNCQDSIYASLQSSIVALLGIFIVFEIAPDTKDWAAAIILIWLSTDKDLFPILPQTLAQSNTGKWSLLRWGAPSSVIAPQTWILAASISSEVKPRNSSILNEKSFICSVVIPKVFLQKSSPNVNWLKTNFMSNADFNEFSTNDNSLSVKPFDISALWLMDWQFFKLPAPKAYLCISSIWSAS